MVHRTRVWIGSAAAALVWMLGYTMGGGPHIGGTGDDTIPTIALLETKGA